MSVPEYIKAWESEEGPKALRRCGAFEGCRVLDFGFGQGHYSVAGAHVVRPAGKVFSLDRDSAAIEAFRTRVAEEEIGNIEVMVSPGGLKIPLGDEAVDFMMLYDIIHHVQADWRELMAEARQVLRKGGTLSVLPFHMEAAAVEALFAQTQAAGFSKPVLLANAGLHIGMVYRAFQEHSGMDFKDAEKGTIYNFTRI